jgi:cytochrome c oxidase subunit II
MTKILSMMFIFCAIAFNATAAEQAIGLPIDWGYDFQLADGELQNTFRQFHNELLVIITAITLFVLGLIAYICVKFNAKRNPNPSNITHNTRLEIIWTVLPIIIVVGIMVKSLNVLYYVDKSEKADMTVKVTGYQWYWGYEYPDHGIGEYESRMIQTKDLKEGQPRLFEVDEALVVPVGKTIRMLLTADPNGVIHAWGVPALGFKRDTVPGRVSEGWIKVKDAGVYYGNCYELCGPDHSQMPIKVVALPEAEFNAWVASKGGQVPGAAIDEGAPAPAAAAQKLENVAGEATTPAGKAALVQNAKEHQAVPQPQKK